jgi:hypothetical protein
MHLLFVHQNFPGQYRHLAAHFARNREHSVAAIGEARSLTSWEDETRAIRCFPYTMPRWPHRLFIVICVEAKSPLSGRSKYGTSQ